MNRKLWIVAMSRRHQSHLMCRRHWLTGMFSFRVFPGTRLLRLSSPTMESIRSTGRGENCYRGLKAERCKEIGAIAGIDVFKAGALSWYLKPRSKEVDASGKCKG